MEDLREQLEELNDLAEGQKEQKARIKGSLDTLNKSLKSMGLTFKQAGESIKSIQLSLNKDNKKLEKLVNEFKDKYADKL